MVFYEIEFNPSWKRWPEHPSSRERGWNGFMVQGSERNAAFGWL